MKIKEIILSGQRRSQLETEIRYATASARVAGTEVLVYLIKNDENPNKTKRIVATVTRLLTEIKREGLIAFFVTPKSFELNNTEAQFFLNKYESLINNTDTEFTRIYSNI